MNTQLARQLQRNFGKEINNPTFMELLWRVLYHHSIYLKVVLHIGTAPLNLNVHLLMGLN